MQIGLLIDADSLNQRRRRFCLRPTRCHIYQGVSWPYHGYCACVQENYIAEEKTQCHNLTSTKLITPKHYETQPRIT
jgi:hypothetical protein